MGNRRIILYVLLGVIMMSLWNAWFLKHPTHKPVAEQSPVASQTSAPALVGPQADASSITSTNSVKSAVPASNAHKNNTKTLAVVDTSLMHLVFNDQGDITQSDLKKYPVSIKDKSPISLLGAQNGQYYQMQSGLVKSSSKNATQDKMVFSTKKAKYVIADGAKSINVKFIGKDKNGLLLVKNYRILNNSYAIDLDYSIKNTGAKAWKGSFYGQIQRVPPPAKTGLGLMGFHSYTGTSFSSPDNLYNKQSFKSFDTKAYTNSTHGGWLAMQQHYFLTAWVPRAHDLNSYYGYHQNWGGKKLYTIGFSTAAVNLQPKEQSSASAKFYVGPELVKQLEQVAPHLSLTIDYGWFWFIASPIFKVLSWVHSFVGNWGFSIIIITLMMQLLFYKLNEKSFTSMAKMRDAAPRIKELQARFADDKPAAQKAMMEFYRDEKINPLGGCFPILIQIPVFIALYWVLGESVVLRQAPFILWIQDLSVRDPYFVLPVLMGISMFIQQRLAPAPPDPTQAKMMMLMPVFMTALFLFFPSGLVLYWLTRNVASIAQQNFITKKIDREKSARKRKR